MDYEQIWRKLDLRLHSAWLLCRSPDFMPDSFEVIPARHVLITCWPELTEQFVWIPTTAIPENDFQLDVPAGSLLVACVLIEAKEDVAIVAIPSLDENDREISTLTVGINNLMLREGKLRPSATHL